MFNIFIKIILIILFIFTPVAFGSVEYWAFSIMELGILLILILWAIQSLTQKTDKLFALTLNSKFIPLLLFLFLLLILFQMLPLPTGLVKLLSPRTYEVRSVLSFEPLASNIPVSFVPFLTQIEFLKWLTLTGLFFFLLFWKLPNRDLIQSFFPIVMLVGAGESLYGMFEFFSGHRHILHLDMQASAVTGTFINRNYFAGYLLMVIPLSMGYLFYREAREGRHFMGWRHRLSSLDGKTMLIAFGIVVVILGLLFSASRMGIASLLLSVTLMSFIFRNPQKARRFSRSIVLIFGLAILWATWIGLDAVISRFFTTSEDLRTRLEFWSSTIRILKDYPLLGTGLGTFLQVFPMYRTLHVRGLVTHAENDWLQLTSEVGILGMGLLVILFIILFYKAVSKIRSLSYWEGEKYIGMGGMVGTLALMLHSLVERNVQVPANAFLYTFLWATILRIGNNEKIGVSRGKQ